MKDGSMKRNNCYGCGICEIVCPRKIIKLERSSSGFYVPVINEKNKCINCGLCDKLCPYSNTDVVSKTNCEHAYAAYSKDKKVLATSSSGGVGYEIGKLLIAQGYRVCGVIYNHKDQRAEHCIANNIEELQLMKGSKYIQSYTIKGFSELNATDKWVVFGTPCQIDSIRRWIRFNNIEDNYILIDIFCHGTPSYLLWDKYLEYQKKRLEIEEIKGVCFRDKKFGWRKKLISFNDGEEESFKFAKNIDLFYSFFLNDICLNACCYNECKFRDTNSSADLKMGDLWGNKYVNNNKGVSGILTFSEKGEWLIRELCKVCVVEKEELNEIRSGQTMGGIEVPKCRERAMVDFANEDRSILLIFAYSILPKIALKTLPSLVINAILNKVRAIK